MHIYTYHGKLEPGDLLYEKLKEENENYIRMCEKDKADWHLIVYLQDNQGAQIVYFSASSNKPAVQRPFDKCLEMIDGKDFNQILMLLTLFPWHTKKGLLRKILTPPKKPRSPLDRVLATTHGWILYRQQFEMIVQMAMGINAIEAIKLRKDYNAGRPVAYALFEKHDLFGEKLSDIIRSRCITRIVHEPVCRIEGAVLLHAYLNG